MTTLMEFNYSKVLDELKSFSNFFSSFSDPAAQNPEFIWRSLQAARDSAPSGSKFVWEITRDRPIRTRISLKAAEGGEWDQALGEFSMIWRLKQGKSPGKGKLPETFSVASASSVLKIKEIVVGTEVTVAEWHFDIGDLDGPGCRLHAQFGEEIELPRLPAPLILPNDSLAYLANELFQKTWPLEVASDASAKYHGSRQGMRLAAVLRSWAEAVSTGSDPFGELCRFRNYAATVAA